jgi:FtsP/CotA-like multicopper oxidase with cupredoxin domain
MDMGVVDYGGGARVSHVHHGGTSVADLTGPQDGTPDVAVTLTAARGAVRLGGGRTTEGFTLNGQSPGPTIRAAQGELVEVTLVNDDVDDGITLHWHGVDVPNAEDGVAGVTQNAVPAGDRHVYRFVVPDAGTYWYHSHQVSHEQVRRGLFGAIVVDPADGPATADPADDVEAVVHTYDGIRTVGGKAGATVVDRPAGSELRVRVVNTDNGALRAWVTEGPYRVLAVDGVEINRPTEVRGETVVVPAGGRVDLGIIVPDGGTRVDLGADAALVVRANGAAPKSSPEPAEEVDLLAYGEPTASDITADDAKEADRVFRYDIGRRPGFLDGKPGFWWTINGKLFPDVPMYVVEEGDLVRMTISNHSGDAHPMHLHGHHALVLSRDGEKATGSPWWVDSLQVADGESYEIAFRADNPGIWMDHCHNLPHAVEGLVAHLMYAGVTEPYRVGDPGDGPHNHPE